MTSCCTDLLPGCFKFDKFCYKWFDIISISRNFRYICACSRVKIFTYIGYYFRISENIKIGHIIRKPRPLYCCFASNFSTWDPHNKRTGNETPASTCNDPRPSIPMPVWNYVTCLIVIEWNLIVSNLCKKFTAIR